MFDLTERSLKSNPGLSKVIIVKSLPRYDPQGADPCSLKSKLNQFGNTLYTSIWMGKGCPTNIEIADQNLECHGPLREKRFGNPAHVGYDGKPWDGIHMRGRLAVTHYTDSLIRILSGRVPSKFNSSTQTNYHQTCPQTQYQTRRQYNKGADNHRNKRRDYHKGGKSQHQGNNFDAPRNQHNGYNVKVSNKFAQLGNLIRGVTPLTPLVIMY